jgi:F-type H+-transporting ATPase subunit a
MAESHSPLEQFSIHRLVPLELGGPGGIDASITNSTVFMLVAVGAAILFLTLGLGRRELVPGRWQSMVEMSYELIANMVRENVGNEGRRYFPFIFTLFMFVLFANMVGMIPFTFTVTSHIIVTFALAMAVFVGVTAIGFARHGLHFLHLFMPSGAPLWTAPVLIPIELVSYLSRPISLAVRLFANMTVGHVILKVVGGFVVTLGIAGVLPGVAFMTVFTGLEVGIAFLQAYIFAILSCVYLNDAIHLH